ncbi:hypothetical protein EXIGLDRAFT_703214 [Exidia glandulosa HHB12029]|uniref:Uncharacterized protein n=1 Tax=Exidia glandulosa HHB12029 TaxID=1314781 RepID=A0A165L9M7_EXIGL|nr:hypothetical protein EXIGLDRAFT_703214 [Exidia glandulosa HHB12029]
MAVTKPATTKKTTTVKKLSAKEIAARDARVAQELQAQVEAMAAELAALKLEQAKSLEKAQAVVQEVIESESTRIERPTGSAGDGFSLIREMKLTGQKEVYKRIQRTVRRCVDRAGLDETKGIRRQDTVKLANIFKASRELQPYLRKFVNDWATIEFVKMLLRNRRQHAARRARKSPEVDLTNEDIAELNNF